MQKLRLMGDVVHAGALLVFLMVVGIKGNASGLSLKSQWLYLMVFLLRYVDLFFTFYSLYNTGMKCFFIVATALTIYIVTQREPAKSTYTPSMDAFPATGLVILATLSSMVIHLVGSGAVNVKGSSGQEFEVHFEHLSFLSWLWTFSILLEPLAMLPQLFIFRKHRLLHRDIRLGIFLMGMYRVFYAMFWIMRAAQKNQPTTTTEGGGAGEEEEAEHTQTFQHHYLLYLTGGFQILTYADFFFYHWTVFMLWCLTRCGGVMGDSSSLIEDAGIETWALTANEDSNGDSAAVSKKTKKGGWQPGDSPGTSSIEMKKAAGLGFV